MGSPLDEAIAEGERGRSEGGIPIGAVLVHKGVIIGRGHNRRVQRGAPCFTVKWMRSNALAGSRHPSTARA